MWCKTDNNMKKKLVEEVNRGNTINLGRSLTDEEVEQVIQMTSFLKKPKNFNERVYCIINDITQQPLDIYGKPARFINVNCGYSYKVDTAIKELKGELISLKKRSKILKDTIKNNTIDANPRIKSIKKFKTRNQNRNSHLYDDDNVLGENYVVCPVTGERMYIVKISYIKNVLKMDTAVYDYMYPGARTVSEDRINRIKTGLREIDPETGLTKYKLAQVKAKESLSRVGDDGLSGYARKGVKTRNTHMNNIDEYGRNGYSQIAVKAIIKGNKTKEKKGMIISSKNRDEFYRYKSVIIYLTEKIRKSVSEGYKTGLAGEEGAFHIDHIFSIKEGYEKNISPFVIADIKNLRMIPWEKNLKKHSSSDITDIELFENVGITSDQSRDEFDQIINIIQKDIKNKIPVSGANVIEKYYESKLRKKQ